MSDLSKAIFHDETKAREWLEARLWPQGPICPKCGTIGEATLMQGDSHRSGLYQCNSCREPFTVTVGTLYERSKVPLHKWLAATHLMMASKKGVSALQIGRMLGLSKKTAWFLCHQDSRSLSAKPRSSRLAVKERPSKLMRVSSAVLRRTNIAVSASTKELAALARKPCLHWSNAAVEFARTMFRQ